MSGQRITRIAVAVALLATGWSVQDGYRRLRANFILRTAELQGAQMVAQGQALRPVVSRNLRAVRSIVGDAPADTRVLIAIGSQYLLLGNEAEAVRWYRRALELESRPEIFLNLGRALWSAGEVETARENFRSYLLLEPARARELPEGARRPDTKSGSLRGQHDANRSD